MSRSFNIEKMEVEVYDSAAALGQAAANDLATILKETVLEQGEASIIVATGNSQRTFVSALRTDSTIPWSKIDVFQMDEYVQVPGGTSLRLSQWARDELIDIVHPRQFHSLQGDASDIEAEIARYADLLEAALPVACVLGIGENAHLAFNDPPADFDTPVAVHVVRLSERSRQQQTDEGHFRSPDEVPPDAITLTVSALLRPANVLAVVPEARKAPAVKASLEGDVTPDVPASVLRRHSNVKLYLDKGSASALEPSEAAM